MWGPLGFFFKEKKPKPKQKAKKGLEELQREKWDYTCTPESWHELQQVKLVHICFHIFRQHKPQKILQST